MTRWVVLVGPGATCETLFSTSRLDDALRAVESLSIVAPALRTAIWFGSAVDSYRVLLIEGGVWRVTVPDSLQPAGETPEHAAPRGVGATPELSDASVDVVHAGSVLAHATER